VNLSPLWNTAPTDNALAVRRHRATGERHLDVLHWGLVPHFTKDLKSARKPISARAESVATSGMFKDAFANAPPRTVPNKARIASGGSVRTKRTHIEYSIALD
jgi:putative SOS response-associated peptidase YedK